MNILLLAPDIPDYSVEFVNALAGRANVTLIAPDRIFRRHESFVDFAVDFRVLDWPRHRSPANLLFLPRLVRMVAASPPSVVHILCESVIWLNLALPFIRRYGLVTTMHDVSYHPGDRASQRVPRRFIDYLVKSSDRIIVHGERLKTEAARRYPALTGRIDVLPHLQLLRYCEMARRLGLKRSDGAKIRILFFGRIFAYKGLDYLIRSIPEVVARFENVLVTIAGEGDDMRVHEKQIAERRFFDIRNYRVSDEETAQLFLDADIVVLPYIEASHSGVLAIANAFGKPTIVTNVGELGQSVEHGQTGLVVPPRDEHALAEAIIQLIADPGLRDRIGAAGRAAAERSASPEIVATMAMAVYEKTTKGLR